MSKELDINSAVRIAMDIARWDTPSIPYPGAATQETLEQYTGKYGQIIDTAKGMDIPDLQWRIFDSDSQPTLVLARQPIPKQEDDFISWDINELDIIHADIAGQREPNESAPYEDGGYIVGRGVLDMSVEFPIALWNLKYNEDAVIITHPTEETGSSKIKALKGLHARKVYCGDGSSLPINGPYDLSLVPRAKGILRYEVTDPYVQYYIEPRGSLIQVRMKGREEHAAHQYKLQGEQIVTFQVSDLIMNLPEDLKNAMHGGYIESGNFPGTTPKVGGVIFDISTASVAQLKQFLNLHKLDFENISGNLPSLKELNSLLKPVEMLHQLKCEVGASITNPGSTYEAETYNAVILNNLGILFDIRAVNESLDRERQRMNRLAEKQGLKLQETIYERGFSVDETSPSYQRDITIFQKTLGPRFVITQGDYGISDPAFLQGDFEIRVMGHRGENPHREDERLAISSLQAGLQAREALRAAY